MIDNYDSFVFNIYQYILELSDEEVRYFRDEKGQSAVKVRANWEYDFTIDFAQQTE